MSVVVDAKLGVSRVSVVELEGATASHGRSRGNVNGGLVTCGIELGLLHRVGQTVTTPPPAQPHHTTSHRTVGSGAEAVSFVPVRWEKNALLVLVGVAMVAAESQS
jgi:hypothetical protein